MTISIQHVHCSFLRHVMEAFVLVLTSDYEFGAMLPAGRIEACKGDGQFEEKVCRHHVNTNAIVCDGRVTLSLDYGAWPVIGERHAQYDVVFWGGGRHPTNGDYTTRHGVYDPGVVISEVVQPLCRDKQGWFSSAPQQVYWLQSHLSLKTDLFTDQHPNRVKGYNQVMKTALGEWRTPLVLEFPSLVGGFDMARPC